METIFKLKRVSGQEDVITVFAEEHPSTFEDKVGVFENVNEIAIEFSNTGNHIPAFVYTEEELIPIETSTEPVACNSKVVILPVENGLNTPVFPSTGKYFSPLLKTQLQKFTGLQKLSIVSDNVVSDDSFPTEYDVEIVSAKSIPRAVVQNISTPDDLYALMTSTNVVELADSYTLMNDIDMTDYVSPSRSIGPSTTYPFKGTFDGQGFTIKIGPTVTNYAGLFGAFGGSATISNVNVTYVAVAGDVSATFSGSGVGTLGGYAGGFFAVAVAPVTYITVTDCNVLYEGNVTFSGTRVGGFGNVFASGIITEFIKIENCNVVCEGNMNAINRIGGFIGNCLGGNMQNCTVLITGDIAFNNSSDLCGGFYGSELGNNTVNNCSIEISNINAVCSSGGGFVGYSQPFSVSVAVSNITNCNAKIGTLNMDLSANSRAGGFIGQMYNVDISNCNLTIDTLIVNNGNFSGGFYGLLSGQTLDSCNATINSVTITGTELGVLGGYNEVGSVVSNITINVKNSSSLTASDESGLFGYIEGGEGINIINNVVATFLDTAAFSGFNVGALVGLNNGGEFSDCVVTFNKQITMDSTAVCGGLCGNNTANFIENCTVFYGNNYQATTVNFGGICGNNAGTLTNCTAVYNAYTVDATVTDPIAASDTGTITDCYTNTFSSDTSIIPNTNKDNILNTLNGSAVTEWASSLLNIRQSLDIANNSTFLSTIFSVSPTVSNVAKNNALNAGMTFAGIPYINTIPSVIQPLLVKYQNPLPGTIRYAVQNDVNEIDVTETAAYYIYQNPAYIIPSNKTITSNTEGDGSIAFDTDIVPVGSDITIDGTKYSVLGVGSSLLEVVKSTPTPAKTENNLSVIFGIIGGIILLIILVFSYVWGWQGYMILPAVIAITMIVLAIVYAF